MDGRHARSDTRVVVRVVQAAERLDGAVDQLLDLLFIGDVGLDEAGFAFGRLDQANGLARTARIDVAHHDPCALARKGQC